jgi:hypothetical protein
MKKNGERMTFYKNSELLWKFIPKYIFVYFLYGWLFLGGTFIMVVLFWYLFNKTHNYIHYLQFFWIVPMSYCFIRFIRILFTTKYKWRIFRIAHYRLNTRNYSENYFKYEVYEPCTRLIVKDILYEYNLKEEYKSLISKYLQVDQRVEDHKDRLLSDVIRRDKQKLTQEV